MARARSQYLTQSGAIEASPIWLIQLLEVESKASPAITYNYYFTDAQETVSFFDDEGNAEAYLPIGVEISPVNIDTSQKMVSFSLTFDNVSRQMATLAGTVKLTSGRCILSRAFQEELSDPNYCQTVFRGSIRSWTIGEQSLELEIGSDIPLINKAPRRLFGVRCQWRYLGTECGFSVAIVEGFVERWWARTSSNYSTIDETATPTITRTTTGVNYSNLSVGGSTSYFNCVIEATVFPKYSEEYSFIINSADGYKLWVNGVNLANLWQDFTNVNGTVGKITLVANKPTKIRVEHYQRTGTQALRLEWSSLSLTREYVGAMAGTFKAQLEGFDTCAKTLDACKERSNQQHFGGFPHIPKSRDPRTIWTKA